MTHKAKVVSSYEKISDHYEHQHMASCSCGWQGEKRITELSALHDANVHAESLNGDKSCWIIRHVVIIASLYILAGSLAGGHYRAHMDELPPERDRAFGTIGAFLFPASYWSGVWFSRRDIFVEEKKK